MKEQFLVYKGLPKDIYVLFISDIINRMGAFILPLMTLILVQKIGLSKSEAGLFATLSMLSQAPFLMLGGKMADKIGSKKVIVIFGFLGALTYVVCGLLKPGIAIAILIVVASNLYAIAAPAYNAIIPEITPPHLIKNAYSLIYLGYNLGLTVGPILGGLLFKSHLNLVFILDALTTIVATSLILLYVRNKRKTEDTHSPAEEAAQETSGRSIFSFLRENPILLIFSAVLLVFNFCYIQWVFVLPLQTVDIFKENGVRLYTILASANAVTVVVLTPWLTSVTQKMHSLKTIYLGGIFYFAAFVIFAFSRLALIFILGIVVLTIGEILININMNCYIAQRTPETHLGRVNSLLSIVNGTGFAIGPVVMGNVLMLLSFQSAWLMVAALILCGVVVMYAVKRYDSAVNPNQ